MYLSMPTKNPKSLPISPEKKIIRMDINETIIVKVQSLYKLNKKCTY